MMKPIPVRTAASGRFEVMHEAEPGAAIWVHRWMGDDFPHRHGDNAVLCLCKPYYVPPGDTRTLDEIADDIEKDEAGCNG